MESFVRVLNIIDQYISKNLKTINIRDYIKNFEWLRNG